MIFSILDACVSECWFIKESEQLAFANEKNILLMDYLNFFDCFLKDVYMTLTIVSFILVLAILVFFHEAGHFITAKLCNVGVEKFSLGFGPRLYGKKIGITDYRISAIPLGGYVKLVGEEPGEELFPEEIPFSFSHKPLFQRMLVVAAGPFSNILLAYIIFVFFFALNGIPFRLAVIGEVFPDTPAHKSGIKVEDKIVKIDNKSIETWDDMASVISNSKGKEICITINRVVEEEEKFYVFYIIPEKKTTKNFFGEDIDRYLIGISSSDKFDIKNLSFIQSLGYSGVKIWEITWLTLLHIYKIIQGVLSPDNIGGPIMIAKLTGDSARAGIASLSFFIAVISISLAIFNLLPIPVLDGGHLMFFLIEGITRKPVSVKVKELSQQIGIAVLVLIMIYVSVNDVMRFLTN